MSFLEHENEFIANKKILVIDDNPLNLKILDDHLKSSGFLPIQAKSGEIGISMALEHLPDLILLDIMMPMMDGFQVAESLRTNDVTKDIPIIFLTAKTQTDDIVKGLGKGAVDYIMKPFNPEELTARVSTHLHLKGYRDKLVQQNHSLNELNTEKNQFLAIAAHDMKNPLYSISLLAKTIRDDKHISREDLEELTSDIITTSDRMLALIADLLDINAIEQGKMKFNLEEIDMVEPISTCLDIYHERAKQKNITLNFTPDDREYKILGDRRAVHQVLDNIVSNAIKYSPFDKNIWASVTELNGNIRCEIKDEGPGLNEEDLKKMFGKFVKLSTIPTGNESSNGLGLSIVKQYVENLGGKVWCESELGKGCNFIVELPKA